MGNGWQDNYSLRDRGRQPARGLQSGGSEREQSSELRWCVAIQVNLKRLLGKKGLSAAHLNVVLSAGENWQDT